MSKKIAIIDEKLLQFFVFLSKSGNVLRKIFNYAISNSVASIFLVKNW